MNSCRIGDLNNSFARLRTIIDDLYLNTKLNKLAKKSIQNSKSQLEIEDKVLKTDDTLEQIIKIAKQAQSQLFLLYMKKANGTDVEELCNDNDNDYSRGATS
jgi:ABC-type phosphate transport system auxiliary subunit